MKTLVLNADYTPISVVPLSTVGWKEAICLVFLGKATALEEYDVVVRSVDTAIHIPSVIVLNKYKKVKHSPKFSKFNIKARDGFTCQYCGALSTANKLTVDHVHPKARGGKTGWLNLVAACKPCNEDKKDHIHIKPKRQPYIPNHYQLARVLLKERKVRPEWEQYMRGLHGQK